MNDGYESLSWTQRRRYEFMEWKLFWEGRFIRDDLEKAFDISTPQASADIKNYRELDAGNFEYNPTEKGFMPTPAFAPRFLRISADRLLLQLRAWLSAAIDQRDLWFRSQVPVDMVPDLRRSVDNDCLRDILTAIRNRSAIKVHYQSLTKSEWRTIAPHALAFDGFRWHARAWCVEKEDFRDFVLARIGERNGFEPVRFDPAHDLEWTQYVSLRLCPHPRLLEDQKQAIMTDFGMVGGYTQISLRASLAYYFIKRMNLDLAEVKGLTPERLQICLENYDEVLAAINQARVDTKARIAEARSASTN